eukprot:superscaffoldBa00004889_g19603
MHNWQENEIKELLTIRGSEAIRNQITGTAKDSVVYNRMTRLLAERGVYRSHMQVISKLKALRKQYTKYHQQKTRCGSARVDWPFYEQCHRVFSNAPAGNPVKRSRTYTVPSKKRKTTVMEQVSTLVSATVTQLREMDAAMQAQEDARLQRLMDHEKEMQNNLMSQLTAMHERISRENHERHLELVDRILSRFPSPSAPSGP